MNLGEVIKIIVAVLGLLGGTITIGDRLWASKSEVAEIKVKVDVTHEKVDFMYQAFMEAAKAAR